MHPEMHQLLARDRQPQLRPLTGNRGARRTGTRHLGVSIGATRRARGNAVRGRLNAAFLSLVDGYVDHLVGHDKRRLLTDLPDQLVELGPGTGANFRYLRPGTLVTAVEPNPYMHGRLRRQARRYGVRLRLVDRPAEDSGLPDGSADVVLCTLVLCSVDDPAAVTAEVVRLLRPGGRFLALEHVAAAPGTRLRRVQRGVRAVWSWLFEGCCVDRDTAAVLVAAPFSDVRVHARVVRSPFVPVSPQIAVTATR